MGVSRDELLKIYDSLIEDNKATLLTEARFILAMQLSPDKEETAAIIKSIREAVCEIKKGRCT